MALTLTNFVQDQIDELTATLGALGIESGSNANGEWFKFPGGLLIQHGTYVCDTDDAVTVNLAIPFVNISYSVLAGIGTGQYQSTKTVSTFTWDRMNDFSGTENIDWIAIGRWE